VDETLRLIDAFQFTDKYGEVRLPIPDTISQSLFLVFMS
jgi:hypothetical protein